MSGFLDFNGARCLVCSVPCHPVRLRKRPPDRAGDVLLCDQCGGVLALTRTLHLREARLRDYHSLTKGQLKMIERKQKAIRA
jgi:hypothetical protein